MTKEEIAVIGGGLGGCLTALMLAKSGLYHVTLIEKGQAVLNGASVIASRLHLGGEYPLDAQTAQDCLAGAIAWKLLMPNDIYTHQEKMKFLVAEETEVHGNAHPRSKDMLTVKKYVRAYEKIRESYEEIFKHAQEHLFNGNEQRTQEALFGSFHKGAFYRPLTWGEGNQDFALYNAGKTHLACNKDKQAGIQSSELGLNVPEYLARIEAELFEEQKGNIEILTGHAVQSRIRRKTARADGRLGRFEIETNQKIIKADQVIQAAWSGGPAIMPERANSFKKGETLKVHKRAMLLMDLPPKFEAPPAFIMLGEHGGMLSHDGKVAVCYIPMQDAAYRGEPHVFTPDKLALPDKWNALSEEERKAWTKFYVDRAKARFSILKDADAKSAHLVIQDTLTYSNTLSERKKQSTQEEVIRMQTKGMTQEVMQRQDLMMEQQQLLEQHQRHEQVAEVVPGLFTMYPLKATYAVYSALEAVSMVAERSRNRDNPKAVQAPPTQNLLGRILTPEAFKKYSLRDMKVPSPQEMRGFFERHPDLHLYEPVKQQERQEKNYIHADPGPAEEAASSSHGIGTDITIESISESRSGSRRRR